MREAPMRDRFRDLHHQRNEILDRMQLLSDRAATEERLLTPGEQGAFDRDQAAVASVDRQLVVVRGIEQESMAMAEPLAQHPSWASSLAMPDRRGAKPFPGQSFTRFVSACALSKGNLLQAAEIAQRWTDQPQIESVLRAAAKLGGTNHEFWLGRSAVAIGTTQDPTWAAPLVNYMLMANEFLELLRPLTIYGRMNGFRRVPFNIKVPRQTAGSSAGWVGEGASKPVSRLSFDMVTLPWAKIAVIVVITIELARFSDPSAEMLVRDDLLAAIAEFMDTQMWDPTVAPAAGIRPGSLTNAVVPIPSSGSTVAAVTADLNQALLALTAATQGRIVRPVWIMSLASAIFLSTLRTAQDVFAFPSMSAGGAVGSLGPAPSLMGIPVITGNVPVVGDIILCEQSEVMVADDGQTTIDTSGEASVQMDTAPATPPTTLVSLWQQNLLGIKAERFIYWMRRREGVVQRISGFPAAA